MGRLRIVKSSEKTATLPPESKQVRALQAFTVMLESGQEAIGIVGNDGILYFTGTHGWVPYNMEVAPDDTQV